MPFCLFFDSRFVECVMVMVVEFLLFLSPLSLTRAIESARPCILGSMKDATMSVSCLVWLLQLFLSWRDINHRASFCQSTAAAFRPVRPVLMPVLTRTVPYRASLHCNISLCHCVISARFLCLISIRIYHS